MRINPEALRTIRRDRGVSTSDLARMVGLKGHSHISNIENKHKEASPELIRALADALRVDVLALLGPERRPGEKGAA